MLVKVVGRFVWPPPQATTDPDFETARAETQLANPKTVANASAQADRDELFEELKLSFIYVVIVPRFCATSGTLLLYVIAQRPTMGGKPVE